MLILLLFYYTFKKTSQLYHLGFNRSIFEHLIFRLILSRWIKIVRMHILDPVLSVLPRFKGRGGGGKGMLMEERPSPLLVPVLTLKAQTAYTDVYIILYLFITICTCLFVLC